jgi:hypothetical protein
LFFWDPDPDFLLIPDPGSRGQKGTGSRIRIRNTVVLSVTCCRRLFKEPEVTPADQVELKWEKPDEEGLIKFMVEEKGFSEERIRNGAKKLLKGREGNTQGRLDSFFKVRQLTAYITIIKANWMVSFLELFFLLSLWRTQYGIVGSDRYIHNMFLHCRLESNPPSLFFIYFITIVKF